MDVIPLFKSHYSIGRSILTLSKPDSMIEEGPDSIIDLCVRNKVNKFFLIDDSMTGFLEGYINSKESDLNMIFGIRISVCEDMEVKDSDSLDQTCKYVIIAKNTEGYKRLIKIYTKAAQEGFYYVPRIDFKALEEFWDDDDLQLVVPFYDSFLHKNYLGGGKCLEAPSDYNLDVFVEDNNLPFDHLILNRVNEFAKRRECNLIKSQSIYYNKKDDFKAYLTFRAIDKRTTLSKPNLEHMGSNEFCFEKWAEAK